MSDDKRKGPHGTDEMPPMQNAPDDGSGEGPRSSSSRGTVPVPSEEPEPSTPYKPAGKVVLAGAAAAPPPDESIGAQATQVGPPVAPPAGSGVSPTLVSDEEPEKPTMPYQPPLAQPVHTPSPIPIARKTKTGGNTGLIVGALLVFGGLVALGVWQVARSNKNEKDEAKPVAHSSTTATASATSTATGGTPAPTTEAPPPTNTTTTTSPTSPTTPTTPTGTSTSTGTATSTGSSPFPVPSWLPSGLPSTLPKIPSQLPSTFPLPSGFPNPVPSGSN
ncbi:MAG: hypothetical protein HOW73_17240 [Polyangiaceae bacterium]|nr:hypothetical protein [Polyangiaceae bacterium]